ncbi:MAG: GNAT family N-acetyltransferase [Clostridiales bacterium]|nr:GNAT family N-acetyltransferase [Clostridiales bacterium]
MTTRTMTIFDYSNVYELWNCVPGIGLNRSDDSFDGFKRYIERNLNTSFVAEYEKKIIGAVLAGHDGRRGYLYHAAVLPQYRNRGIGRKLINQSLDALAKEGISKVGLLAFRENDAGNAFWEVMGFGARDDCTYRDKMIREMIYQSNPYLRDKNN